jgi:hypothetical protein
MTSQLIALRSAIMQQLHAAKDMEGAARCSYSRTGMGVSVGRLAMGGIIKMTSPDNKLLSAFGDQLLRNPAGKQRPFGKVLVCIDSRGLPDGVGVASISHLARGSHREESAVTNELLERGCLLFSENVFSLLIDKLIEDIREGRLTLPIPSEKLPQLEYTVQYRPDGKVAECLPHWSFFDEGKEERP